MDKKVIFAVAGSGKTRLLIDDLTLDKRSIIITYTNNNYKTIKKRILDKFGYFPENITLLTYFSFIYKFCYRPFLSKKYKSQGITYKINPNQYAKQSDIYDYYFDKNKRMFSNRISKFLIGQDVIGEIKTRLSRYFDCLYFDEIQDLSGNDFNFFLEISKANLNILAVGDFYQHTYDTSRDGTVNCNLHNDYSKYKKRFEDAGLLPDEERLQKSYRCSSSICKFVKDNIGIDIESCKREDTKVEFIDEINRIQKIMSDMTIIKLFYQESYKYSCYSKNWGDCKGEDHHHDVCVVLNNTTLSFYKKNTLYQLVPLTKNKFYVACTRANNNLYFIPEKSIFAYKNND